MSGNTMQRKVLSRVSSKQIGTSTYLLAALAVVVILQIELIFSKSINWDEFYHFSEITEYNANRPTEFFQTPYVKLFWWIPQLGGGNIFHIQLARFLSVAFELVTVCAIVAMSNKLVDQKAALVSGLAFASAGFVFLHAFALRSDMVASALLMVSLYLFMTRPLRGSTLLIAVSIGIIGFLCTIKSVLYAPAFLGVVFYRLESRSHRVALVTATLLAVLVGCSFIAFGRYLPSTGSFQLLHDASVLGRTSIDWMFTQGFFPQSGWALQQALLAPFLTIAVVMTGFSACRAKSFDRLTVMRIGLLGPLLTVPFYYNAYPYHYAFILPPAVVAVAPEIQIMLRRYGYRFICGGLVVGAVILSLAQDREVIERQRTIQTGIRQMFPRSVVYIDNCGLAGDFPRAVNKFATAWSLRDYRRKGVPAYSDAMRRETVPLLLINAPTLRDAINNKNASEGLLPEDRAVIRSNFIPHWGFAYVAGKIIPAGSSDLKLEFAVPGPYTVEGGRVTIDGVENAPGNVVLLARGLHNVDSITAVTLRWGDHLPRPTQPWPQDDYFTNY